MQSVVIVGSGLAGYTLARELRKLNGDISLTVVCADDGRSYSKPMLSNALAKGKGADELAMADADKMAADLAATIHARTRVLRIDTAQRRLITDGPEVPYDRLVLAVGATPIELPVSGDAADAVMHVNNLEDYAHLRECIDPVHRVAVVGAGLIGCEFANDLLGAGYTVHVIGRAPQALDRLLPLEAGERLQHVMGDAGVHWHLGTTAMEINHAGDALELRLADGDCIQVDAVLSAIGLRPNTALADEADLVVNRGVVVDRHLRSSDPNIYALGDCAEVDGLVLPFVMPIMHAARALAATLYGTPTPLNYPAMPVVVKTPLHPVVVSPPARDAQCQWQIEASEGGVKACCYSEGGELLGFALTGATVAEKQALTKLLPPLLG
ncbi:MAG: FAD-dependent oxidoreductase [Pseudomonadota bacterium]|nr:MAG: FAD-dependent oxidoreductase [Pseudomonadota bacterium]